MNNERIIKAIIKKWKLILIVVLISTGLTVISSIYNSKPMYQAKTSLYVTATDNIAISQQLVKDYSELIKSEKITKAVVEKLGLKDGLTSSISIDTLKGSNLIQLSVYDKDPKKAQTVANAFANILIEKIVTITNKTNLKIVDEASLPVYPVSTNKSKTIILSFFLSLVVICGLIILLEYIDNTVHTVEDVEKELGYSVIGIIPEMDIK